MYKGKHNKEIKSKHSLGKILILMVSVMIIAVGAIGTTMAYLSDKTGSLANTFEFGKPDISITEEFDKVDGIKKNVAVINNSDFDSYIRAMVIMTWKDKDGNVHAAPVRPEDISLNIGSKWTKNEDGYYYYSDKVQAGASTKNLIDKCVKTDAAQIPERGYDLSVEISAELIQAEPARAAEAAWGVTVASDGTITPKTTI